MARLQQSDLVSETMFLLCDCTLWAGVSETLNYFRNNPPLLLVGLHVGTTTIAT